MTDPNQINESHKTSHTTAAPKDLMGFLEYYLATKAPFAIPDKGREWLVKYMPWITLVLLVLFLPVILLAFGLSAFFLPFSAAANPQATVGLGLASIVLLLQLGLMIGALPGLFARQKTGWNLLFYSDIINLLYSILSGSIIGGILSAVIGLYILFQIRPYYK